MSQITPIIVVGAAGRMGQMILECAGSSEEPFQLVAALERPEHPAIGKELNTLLVSAPEGLKLTDQLPSWVPPGTVLIDFTVPQSTMSLLDWVESTGNGIIIATTGFNPEERARIERAAQKAPILFSPNMSVGVNVLFKLVAEATKLLGPAFDVEITEMHHRFKKDAPSGTARGLLEVVLEARQDTIPDVRHGREGFPGARTSKEIGMHSIRGGDVVGDHTVYFSGLGERVELTHRASTRETFARGALRAANWLTGREPGLYSMKDVLGL